MAAVKRTPAGEAATATILATFRANGLLLAAGDDVAGEEALSSALWQVLGAVALADAPLTVPQIARRMGRTRQSVQASVDRLRALGVVESLDNPDHRRSPLHRPTDDGRRRFARLQRRPARWVDELTAGMKAADLATAARVLRELSERLEASARRGGEDR